VITAALMLAWLVVLVGWVLPLFLTGWMVAKGGVGFLMDEPRHESAVKEVMGAIPGATGLRWLSRLASLALAVCVLAGGLTGLCS
jgi:hypothetical protein